MKVWISPYRNHWVPAIDILRWVCVWHYIPLEEEDVSPYDDPWIDRVTDRMEPFCAWLQKVLDKIHPPVRYVKIERQDTWSLDHTLAHVILPALKQLQATQHGSGIVDVEDVPEHLHPKVTPSAANNYDDPTVHDRWKWVMDEMIWAFEQKITDDDESKFFDHSGVDKNAGFQQQMSQIKMDKDGLKAHQDRKQNGFRLFGKYYQNLWD